MKKQFLIGAALAILGTVASPLMAQQVFVSAAAFRPLSTNPNAVLEQNTRIYLSTGPMGEHLVAPLSLSMLTGRRIIALEIAAHLQNAEGTPLRLILHQAFFPDRLNIAGEVGSESPHVHTSPNRTKIYREQPGHVVNANASYHLTLVMPPLAQFYGVVILYE